MRLIDADKLVEILQWSRRIVSGGEFNEGIDKAVDVVLEVLEDTESFWIPCTERLPVKAGTYLISRTDYDGVNDEIVKLVEVANFDPNNEYCVEFFMLEADAWMPLPEPWEGEQK